MQHEWENVERGLYRDRNTGQYYERIRGTGRNTWQCLFEALTGLRTGEALSLRMDARPDEPGGSTQDGGSLCVRRSKNPSRDNPYAQVHDGLKELLSAHKSWRQARYPKSPWYFPGRDREAGGHVFKDTLTKALDRLFETGVLKKKFISHGMRAFYVLVRRSHGASDAQIAWEINHTGGVGTLEIVYGGIPPHWLQGQGPKLSWMPKGKPAWKAIRPLKGKKRWCFLVGPADSCLDSEALSRSSPRRPLREQLDSVNRIQRCEFVRGHLYDWA